ncbi:MAG: T9SS type A sorting domain-containing protein, partial [Gemmatimonadetes bacterium]|nr:T9SS type A sorting domain-containing protein [Gemmatimonadota bacterium]
DSYNNSTRVEATVRVAEAADAALSDLLFYPNPTPDGSGHFTYILSALAESAQLRVFALSGRLIDQVEAGAGFGYNQVAWEPPTNLAGGTYLFRLEINLTDGPRIEADGRLQVVP